MSTKLSLLSIAALSLLSFTAHAQDGMSPSVPSKAQAAAKSGEAVEGGAFPITTIFTNLSGDPTSAVPGLPGVSFEPGTGTTQFDRVFGSPNGNWILTADTDLPTGADEVLLVNGTVMAVEGDPAPWTGGTENIGFLETRAFVNDSGDFVFGTNTDGPTASDEYMVSVIGGTSAAAAQEGAPIAALAGAFWGSTIESGMILADGTVGAVSDSITGAGVTTSDDEIAVLGAALLAREGVDVPTGQLGSESWENLDVNDFWTSADGSSWLAQGDLNGSTTSDDVVVVDGAVVIQEDVVLAGSGFAEPVDGSGILGVHMDGAGNWYARGNNDTSEQDWVYGNGALITAVGSPILTGASELWSDAEFSDCFFLHVGNTLGDFVIGGVSDAATDANGVLVLNDETEVVRESDPVDIDGNGMFDDDAFFDTFGNDDAHLTDGGILYIVATIKDGTGTRTGQGFFSIDLSSIIPVELQSFTVE